MRDIFLSEHMGHHVFGLIIFVFYAAAADDEQAIGMLAVEPERMIASPFLHAAQGAVVLAWAAQHERQIVGLILSFRRLGEGRMSRNRMMSRLMSMIFINGSLHFSLHERLARLIVCVSI